MSVKKRIVIFHCGFIYSGGGERIVLEEGKGLLKRGYDVQIYAPTLDNSSCFPEFIKEIKVKTFFPSFIDGLPLRNALRMITSSILAPILSIKFRNTDIFIGANQPGVWLAFCISKILGKPYIVYLNQPNRIVYPRPVDKEFGWYSTVKDYHFLYKFFQIIKPLIAWLDKISIVNANSILTNGGYIGGVIENIFAKETIDCPAGAIIHSKSELLLDQKDIYDGKIKIGETIIKKPYILITNRHDPQKRFDYVISALKTILKDFKNVQLVIPGPFTEHTNYLSKLAKRLRIDDKIYFLGKIKEEQLQELYKNACVYCYPSPEEDFGLGPLEAGSWAVPTVAWNHGGPTITVENNKTGFLVNPYDIEDYAKYILQLLKDKNLRNKMGLAAWERTKNQFSWERHLDIMEREIKKYLK